MSTIRLAVDGPLARVTLDRPDVLNAGNAAWVRDLGEIVAGQPQPTVFEEGQTVHVHEGERFVSIRERAEVA